MNRFVLSPLYIKKMLARTRVRLCSGKLVKDFLESPPELFRLNERFELASEHAVVEKKLNAVIGLSEKVHQLKLKRMQMLSLPAHSVTGRNRELLSLGIAAVSGALSLSIHPGFSLVFLFAYRMYRSANEPTRERLQGAGSAKHIQQEISEINGEINQLLIDVRILVKNKS